MNQKHRRPHADNVTAADNKAHRPALNWIYCTPALALRQIFAQLFQRAWRLAEVDPEVQRRHKHRRLAAWLFDVIAAREVCP